jgi:hypothetical protein
MELNFHKIVYTSGEPKWTNTMHEKLILTIHAPYEGQGPTKRKPLVPCMSTYFTLLKIPLHGFTSVYIVCICFKFTLQQFYMPSKGCTQLYIYISIFSVVQLNDHELGSIPLHGV